MPSHKSKSGPVIVRKVAAPQPLTAAQEEARLLHKLALLDDRIASRMEWVSRLAQQGKLRYISPMNSLLDQRENALMKLNQLRGAVKDALTTENGLPAAPPPSAPEAQPNSP